MKTYIDVARSHLNERRGSECGYCHGTKPGIQPGHASWGISSTKMATEHYQKLMERGWRRCGAYYYKYDFTTACCQPYTIRLDVNEFEISKSQKKVLVKFNKFLNGEVDMGGKSVV